MDSLVIKNLPTDLRTASKVMRDMGTFETGQGIMNDAANEIERLRAALSITNEGVSGDDALLAIDNYKKEQSDG